MISFEYVSFGYDGSRETLAGLNAAIRPGECVLLCGASGCGKTTVGRTLLRIYEPDAGKILFDGSDLRGLNEEQWNQYRGRNIAMIFQEPMTALNPLMKVGRQIAENARIAQDQGEYQKRYDSLAKRFDRTKDRLEAVERSIAEKKAHREMVEQFLSELAKQDAVTEFTDELWYSMIDHVTIHSKDDIRFTFQNGTEIRM